MAEAKVNDGMYTAAVLCDLKSFFDFIDHDLLRKNGARYGFPPVLLEMAIQAYLAPRILSSKHASAPPICPTRGVLAGHAFALALVQLAYLEQIDTFCTRFPGVAIDIHVDDIVLRKSVSDSSGNHRET